MAADEEACRETILYLVRRIGGLWMWLDALQNGASGGTLRKIENIMGGEPRGMSDSRAWRLTIEIIMRRVDEEMGVRNACRAAFARHVLGSRFSDIAEQLCRPTSIVQNEIIPRATALFFAEIVARNITDEYRELAA